MAFTSLDIRKTEFTRRLRGFDADEVAAYLELLAREFEGMQHEVQAREERVRELENRIQHYERIELALEEALRTTRESSRQAIEAAHQKADQIRTEAAREAERVTSQAEQEHTRLRQEAQAIAGRRREIVARLRAFLMSEMEVLAHFEGEDPIGFIKLMPHGEALLQARGGEAALAQGDEGAESTPPASLSPETTSSTAPPAEADDAAPQPQADYPTPVPPLEVPSPDVPVAPMSDWPEFNPDTAPEAEAFSSDTDSGEVEASPTPSVPPATSAIDDAPWPTMSEEARAPGTPSHADEPGEVPVPPESDAELVHGAFPDEQPKSDLHLRWGGREDATPAPVPGPEAAAPEAVAPPPASTAPDFAPRAVHRERFRIETFVGPAVPAATPADADADMSEESEHIRRLLDRLD